MSTTHKLRLASTTLDAWRDDERASWEDHGEAQDHVHVLLGRRKTMVVVKSADELERLIASAQNVATGWDDRPTYRAAVGRVGRRLAELRGQV